MVCLIDNCLLISWRNFSKKSEKYKEGEWKMMVTDTPLEYIFQIISENAFKVHDGKEGVFNPDDPIFIGLNLNTNSNLSCLNLIGFLITKYFRETVCCLMITVIKIVIIWQI